MSSPSGRLVAAPLAGKTMDLGPGADFVLAEWQDDGRQPGQLIAPPHVHLDEDEAWYVLEGRLGFRFGNDEVDAGPGTAVYGLKGIAHTYWNPDPLPARYLLLMRPRTFRLTEALHDGTQRDRAALEELFRDHAMTLLG